jgi:predicted transcriptional regulator
MSSTIEKAVEALEMMPDDMREHAVAYLVEQAEKYRLLKAAIEEGLADVEAGRIAAWDPEDILRRAVSKA